MYIYLHIYIMLEGESCVLGLEIIDSLCSKTFILYIQ